MYFVVVVVVVVPRGGCQLVVIVCYWLYHPVVFEIFGCAFVCPVVAVPDGGQTKSLSGKRQGLELNAETLFYVAH